MKLFVILISVAVLNLSSAIALPTTELPIEKVTPGPVKDNDNGGEHADIRVIGETDGEENVVVPEIVDEETDDEENVIDPEIVDEEIDEEENIIEPEIVNEETDGNEEETDNEETDDDGETDEEETEDDDATEDDEETDGDKESQSKEFKGIDFDLLTEEEIEGILDAEEEIFTGELDMYLGTAALVKRYQNKVTRPKRWVPLAIAGGRLAFAAGRAFLSRYARNGITPSGARITKHYSRPGNYFTGLREFKRLSPTNVKRIGGSKFNGWTGTTGNYRVTVRSGSKGKTGTDGPPTLSISSKGGNLVRKFRFD